MPVLQRILQRASTTFALLIASLIFVIISQSISAAQTIPYKINFQGRLADNNGNIVANGLYNIKFTIYNASSGGTNVWQEYRQTTNRVQITNGLFDVRFGDVTALSPTLFENSTQLYLEVELPTPATATCSTTNCASFTEGPLSPRQPIAATPYAFNSDTIDGIDGSSLARVDAANTFAANSNFTGGLQRNGNTVCDTSNNCSYAASSGSASYIQNSISPQTANFNIAGDGTITGTLTNTDAEGDSIIQGNAGLAGRYDFYMQGGAAANQSIAFYGGDAGNNFLLDGFQVFASAAAFSGTLSVSGTSSFTGVVTLGTQASATTHAVRADRNLVAGDGLFGGGNLVGNRTFSVGAGTGISVTADAVAVDSTVCRNTNNCSYAAASGSANYIQNGTASQTGNFALQSASPSSVVGVVRGAVGQTADIMQFKNAGSITLGVTAVGDLQSSDALNIYAEGIVNPHVTFGQAFGTPTTQLNSLTQITAPGAAVVPLAVKAAALQTANLVEVKTATDAVLMSIGATGTLTVAPSTPAYGIIVKDSSGNTIFSTTPGGALTIGNGGAEFTAIKKMTINWDPPSTAAGATSTTTVNLTDLGSTGTMMGVLPPSVPCSSGFGCSYSSRVGADNRSALRTSNATITNLQVLDLYFVNGTAGAVNPGSASWTVWYIES